MRYRQSGVSAIMALVLIVLFALLGAYMATITGVQSLTGTLSRGTDQAWFAANGAAEWAIHQVTAGAVTCPASQTLGNPVLGGAAAGFDVRVDVSCGPPVTEANETYNVYQLLATASRGTVGEPGFVSRTVRVSVTDAD